MSIPEALEVLGLEQRTTPSEIKMAYREQVKRWHPDRFGGEPQLTREAEARLQEINRAYTVLQNYNLGPETVRLHDAPYANQKPLPLNVAPIGSQPSAAERRGRSKWMRTAWVTLAVVAISVIGFCLNRFVADDNDLSFAAAALPAANTGRTQAMPSPVIVPALPVVTTAIKSREVSDPVTVSTIQGNMPTVHAANVGFRRAAVRAQLTAPRLPSDPDVPDLALGDRLDIRSQCLSEAAGGGQDSYSECFLRKLEEHPRPIHVD